MMNMYSSFKHFFRRKSKTFHMLILSYSLVLLVPIVTTFFICVHYQSVLSKQQNEQNLRTLDTVAYNAGNVIREAQELYTATVRSDHLVKMLSFTAPSDFRNDRDTSSFLMPLCTYYSDAMKNLFLYMENADTVLAKNAICDSNLYYRSFFESISLSYTDWQHCLADTPRVAYTSYYNETTKKTELLYRVPYISDDGKKLVLCAAIDNDMLFSDIDVKNELFYNDVYLSDAEGHILSSYLNLKVNPDTTDLGAVRQSYSHRYTMQTKSIYIGSGFIDVTIVSLQPIYSPQIRQTLLFSLMLTLFCLLLCCFMIVYFCTRHYTPISEFMRLLNIENAKDDYTHIRQNIESILSANSQFSHQADTLANRQRKLVLSKFISGNYTADYVANVLKINHISFMYPRVGIVIFKSTNLDNLYFNTAELSESASYSELLFIVENIFTELYAIDGYSCDIADTNGYICCIVNSNEPSEHFHAVIEETTEFGLTAIQENFGIHLEYTVSSLDHTPDELSVAASEAMYLMNYKNMIGNENALFYSSYKDKFSGSDLYFSEETESTLINYIQNGQKEKALLCLNAFFDKLRADVIQPEHLRCILIDMALVLFKLPGYEFEKEEQETLFSRIFSSSVALEDMRTFLSDTIEKICDTMHQNSAVYKDRRLDRIKEFIHRNYTNPAFSMKFISNEFHLDASYLTRQFKEHTGMSIIDYVNKLRIEKAKEYMHDAQHMSRSIESIAQEVGYSSVRTFNRIFTKKEGITPAAYKKSKI